jgi:hypothetical protein
MVALFVGILAKDGETSSIQVAVVDAIYITSYVRNLYQHR